MLVELFGEGNIPTALTERLLRTRDVAALFQVSERTIVEWARKGLLPSVRTPGGQRRYPAEGVRAALHASGIVDATEPATE